MGQLYIIISKRLLLNRFLKLFEVRK